MTQPPLLTAAVVMQRRRQPNRWEDWGLALEDVLPDDGRWADVPGVVPEPVSAHAPVAAHGAAPHAPSPAELPAPPAAPARVLRDDGHTCTWLFPGLPVRLFRDEAEGYYLNLSSGQPVWFVMWRIHTLPDGTPQPRPEAVSLSYHEAGRWLDAQERVDNRPLPPDMVALLQAFVDEHHRPEPKRRARPASFRAPGER